MFKNLKVRRIEKQKKSGQLAGVTGQGTQLRRKIKFKKSALQTERYVLDVPWDNKESCWCQCLLKKGVPLGKNTKSAPKQGNLMWLVQYFLKQDRG